MLLLLLQAIVEKFEKIGSRVKIFDVTKSPNSLPFSITIQRDLKGEYFDIRIRELVELIVTDVQKKDRHLLLMVRDFDNKNLSGKPAVTYFLCGHDERNWFVCGIPTSVTSVTQAKQVLKPPALRDFEAKHGLKASRAHKRHRLLKSGLKVHRQGEFMFIPVKGFTIPEDALVSIHKNTPLRRGGLHIHTAEFEYHTGGTTVWVSDQYPESLAVGFTDSQRKAAMKKASAKRAFWTQQVREPTTYVKGKITHPEHATLNLGNVWHKVEISTEHKRGVAFFD